MKIWITKDTGRCNDYLWAGVPILGNGSWGSCQSSGTGNVIESALARLMLGDQWQPNGPFCFEVEIGEVKRVGSKKESVLSELRGLLELSFCTPTIEAAIALIENPDSSTE